ncbi:MAG: GntR family transcriptional regulator [Protaetiibacter sp.]
MALPPRAAHAREQLKHVLAQLSEGDALPPERVLAETFGVSRMTLRRAVDELVLAGTLERRPGSGTYVSRSRMTRRIAMTSFSEDMRRRGLTPETRMISFETRRADRLAAHRLRVPVGETVYEFTRLRLADSLPLAVETTTIPATRVPGLRRDDLETSWYQLLVDRWGIVIDHATLDIHAVLPPTDVVERLEIDERQPCVQLIVESSDRTGSVIELGRSYYRGDRYSLRAELLGPSPS